MSDLSQDLAAFDDEPIDDTWTIDSPDRAAWAMRKYAALQAQIDEIRDVAASERARIDDWETARTEVLTNEQSFFSNHLTAYALAEREQGRKTVSTPYGKVATRETGAKVSVTDAETLTTWVQAHIPDVVKTRHSVDMGAFSKRVTIDEATGHVHIDGEVIPGTSVEPAKITTSLKVTS